MWCYTVRNYGQKCTLGVQQLVNGAVALKRQPCTLSTTIANAIQLQLYFLFETAPHCVSDAETVFNCTHTQRQFFTKRKKKTLDLKNNSFSYAVGFLEIMQCLQILCDYVRVTHC